MDSIGLLLSEETESLLRDPSAFMLLTQIAVRSRDGNIAVIGDHKNIGLTRYEYRSALNRLEKLGYVATRRTNNGTTAIIVTDAIYSLSYTVVDQQIRQQNDQRFFKSKANNGNGSQDLLDRVSPADSPADSPAILESKPSKDKDKYNDKFNEIWLTYPRRNGKRIGKSDCWEWINKKRVDLDLLAVAILNYAGSRQVARGYIRDPIRFLKKDYWQSWLEPETSKYVEDIDL